MQDICAPFNSKNITILGLGLLGRGVGDAEFLAGCGAHILVTDKKDEIELAESVRRLQKFPNITFHLGGHHEKDFANADLVIKAAGVPLDSLEIETAKKNNVPVVMSTALFAKTAMEIGAKIVGVTGTRGKSTTAQMIYEVLKASGKKVLLGGNVRGVSTLAMLPDVQKDTICVLELDSWQLQGFGDLQISPNISVFTNLMPDHMNYYSGDTEKYFADKSNIFRFQKTGDILFAGKSISEKISAAHPVAAPQIPQQLPEEWQLKIPGEHNRENASLAAAVLRALNISDEEIKRGLESFEAVEGRLQFVREVNGARIYNDNNSTTPDATIAALQALHDGRQTSVTPSVTLIAGGSEKNLDLEGLVSSIKQRCSDVILLTHDKYDGSLRLAKELREANVDFEEANSLQQAVDLALREAKGTILFSPAFASFGMFKNEYERGDEFLRVVRAL